MIKVVPTFCLAWPKTQKPKTKGKGKGNIDVRPSAMQWRMLHRESRTETREQRQETSNNNNSYAADTDTDSDAYEGLLLLLLLVPNWLVGCCKLKAAAGPLYPVSHLHFCLLPGLIMKDAAWVINDSARLQLIPTPYLQFCCIFPK